MFVSLTLVFVVPCVLALTCMNDIDDAIYDAINWTIEIKTGTTKLHSHPYSASHAEATIYDSDGNSVKMDLGNTHRAGGVEKHNGELCLKNPNIITIKQSTIYDGWAVEKIQMYNMDTSVSYIFICNCWIKPLYTVLLTYTRTSSILTSALQTTISTAHTTKALTTGRTSTTELTTSPSRTEGPSQTESTLSSGLTDIPTSEKSSTTKITKTQSKTEAPTTEWSSTTESTTSPSRTDTLTTEGPSTTEFTPSPGPTEIPTTEESSTTELTKTPSQTDTTLIEGPSTSYMPETLKIDRTTTHKKMRTCSCLCSRLGDRSMFNLTQEQIKKAVEKLKADIKVDKSKLSSTIRQLTSAKDERSSSQAIGFVGSSILISLGVILIIADTKTLMDHFKMLCRNLNIHL